ncbi:uncharacterized protein LOC136030167 isoform X2 [Artemia franciscana]
MPNEHDPLFDGVVRNVRFNMLGQIDRKTYEVKNLDGPLDFSKRRRVEPIKSEPESVTLNELVNMSHQYLTDNHTPPLVEPPSLQCLVRGDQSLEFTRRVSPQSEVSLQAYSPRAYSPTRSPYPLLPRRKNSVPAGIHLAPEVQKDSSLMMSRSDPSQRRHSRTSKLLIGGDIDVNSQFRNFTGSETERKLREDSRQRYEEFRREMIDKMEMARKARVKHGRTQSESRESYSSDDQRFIDESLSAEMGKDSEYYYRRKKNNEAAKKSRDLRRTREEENEIKVQFYEMENENLRNQLSLVLHQLALYRGTTVDKIEMTRPLIPCVERN